MKGFVFGLFSQFGKVDVNSIAANDLLTTITWMWMLHNKMLMKQLLWETDTIIHFHSEHLLKYQTTSYHRPCIFKPITCFKILNVTEWLQKINKNKNKLLPEQYISHMWSPQWIHGWGHLWELKCIFHLFFFAYCMYTSFLFHIWVNEVDRHTLLPTTRYTLHRAASWKQPAEGCSWPDHGGTAAIHTAGGTLRHAAPGSTWPAQVGEVMTLN